MSITTTTTFLILVVAAVTFMLNRWQRNAKYTATEASQAFILVNRVTHARLLPVSSKHAFTYPTVCFLLSLDALENKSLDLARGLIFNYGRTALCLTGLRSDPYLMQGGERTIRQKLEHFLEQRGFLEKSSKLEGVWFLTMPSFLGYEGINPLSLYFCYRGENLWLAVFEIHNTFGENHVHILEVGTAEDENPSDSYDHQWTFRREFHVSPFNDRSGFYTVSVKAPSYSPNAPITPSMAPPKPIVRVHLYTDPDPSMTDASDDSVLGPLKLTAVLRSSSSIPLTTTSLLRTLLKYPFELVLSLPRIFYQAYILHYALRLDVFLRPEPLPPRAIHENGVEVEKITPTPGGVKWLNQGALERVAHRRLCAFLTRRVEETAISVTLTSSNPDVPDISFHPTSSAPIPGGGSDRNLTIHYLSPKFFTTVFICPSASHALLLGSQTEKLFQVSSESLFVELFSQPATTTTSAFQTFRAKLIPDTIDLPIPAAHPLDDNNSTMASPLTSWWRTLETWMMLRTLVFLDAFEEWVFKVAHARIVEGDEPWKQWDRASEVLRGNGGRYAGCRRGGWEGSVRRD